MSCTKLLPTTHIIGASSSIGFKIAQKFIEFGSNVIGTYSEGVLANASSHLADFQLDLSSDQSIDSFASDLRGVGRNIDVLIFLAGVLPGKRLGDYDFSEIDKVMSVNFCGQAKVLSRVIPLLTHDACILMFSSISARRGSFDPIYAASKGALLSFVKSMASKLPSGARINALAPGLIEGSSMYKDMEPRIQELHRDQSHSKNLLSMEDLADIVFDICQLKWSHLNGACIDLNGGAYV